MNIETLAILNSTPPPPRKMYSVGAINAENFTMETTLGLPHGAKIYSLRDCVARNTHLKGLLAEKSTNVPAPSKPLEYARPAAAPVQTVASPVQPGTPLEMPLANLRALGTHLFGTTPTATREKIEARINFAGLKVAGISPAKHVVPRTGLDFAVQAQFQKKADAFLSTLKN